MVSKEQLREAVGVENRTISEEDIAELQNIRQRLETEQEVEYEDLTDHAVLMPAAEAIGTEEAPLIGRLALGDPFAQESPVGR